MPIWKSVMHKGYTMDYQKTVIVNTLIDVREFNKISLFDEQVYVSPV